MNPPPFNSVMHSMSNDIHGSTSIHAGASDNASGKVHASHRERGGRYKERFIAYREKFEKATRSQEVYQKQLELANAKIKKLQAENDFLLDTLIFDEDTYNHYFPPTPSELDGRLPPHRERSNIFRDLPSNQGIYPAHAPLSPEAHGHSVLPPHMNQSHQLPPATEEPSEHRFAGALSERETAPSTRRSRRSTLTPANIGAASSSIPHPEQSNPSPNSNHHPQTQTQTEPPSFIHSQQQIINLHTPVSPTPPGHGGHSFGRYPIMQTNGRGDKSPPPPPPPPADPNCIVILNQTDPSMPPPLYERPLEFIQHDANGRVSR